MIEILGAITIVGLLWAGAAYVLPHVVKYAEAQSKRGQHLRELDIMEALFGRDVRTMARLDNGRGRVQGTNNSATWYTVTMNGTRSITYRIDSLDGNLVREEGPAGTLNAQSGSAAELASVSRDTGMTVVARGVGRLDFSYFDAETRSWSPSWDGDRRGKLPDAVALDIVFARHPAPHRTVSAPRAAGEAVW